MLAVARLAKSLERSMGGPQDVEWAIDADLPEGENLVAPAKPAGNGLEPRRRPAGRQDATQTGIAGRAGTLLAPVQAKH